MKDFLLKHLKKDLPLEKKLHESEKRYRRLFESAKDGILILDYTTGNIQDANPYIVKMIGHPLKEIMGKKLWEIGLFDNKEQSEKTFAELKAKDYVRFEDMPIQRDDGKITEVEFISNVYLVNDKKVIQCNIREITERKRNEKKLQENEKVLIQQNQDYAKLNMEYLETNKKLTESLEHIQKMNITLSRAKAKAEESDKLKSAFLANMSHEIRTPMNAIVGFSGFLSEPGLSKEQQEHFVQIINASSQQLLAVINDIIDISKIEAGQFMIKIDQVEVNELMNELYITYQKIIDLKELELNLSCEFPDDDIRVRTDGSRVRQVLCNLLNNALKFTYDGSIELGYNIQEDVIAFYVKDSGMGIAPENQEVIFQRFRQLDELYTNTTSGNGLGLSISKALVEKLGGNISVISDNGVGSTFTFTIPYSTRDNHKKGDNHVKDFEKTDNPDDYTGTKDKTVLIVEDEPNNHAYLTQLLSSVQVKVLHAWNGWDAVELVKDYPEISSVLMDIKMPVMDGYEATRRIKEIRPELPVIAQTAYVFDQDREQAMQAGCDDYIPKPINKELLIKTLNGSLS